MPRVLLWLIAPVICGLACLHADLAHAKRVALIIGNAGYKIGPLQNPANDATAVADAFAKLGFDKVLLMKDLGAEAFRAALLEFSREASGADVAVVYFAGHGTEINGENFLIPIDARLTKAADLSLEAIPLASVLDQLGGASKLKLVVLDACRNNLFPLSGGKRKVTRGLSRVEPEGNTLVAYAAKDGTTADDGIDRPHSPFTAALLKHIATPRLEVTFIFRRVRDDVLKATAGQQQPHLYGTLGGEPIYLLPVATAPVTAAEEPPPGAAPGKCRSPEIFVAVAGQEPVCIRPGSGVSFKDCVACPEMVVIPAGRFVMGSPATDADRGDDEGPPHEVQISRPLAVGKFEVTFDEWAVCVAAGGCNAYLPKDEGWGRGRRPVIHVSWHDAKAYVAWLSRATGQAYRLLTEAEWEYAARAGSTTSFFFGDDSSLLCRFANGADRLTTFAKERNTTCAEGFGAMTAPVGTFLPNAFDLHDMAGNVWEWVEDCYQPSYKGAAPDGAAKLAAECATRVVRGGSWHVIPRGLRSAFRVHLKADYRDDDVGFRIARQLGG
jgi:formylglycine-generating enzyme required for sulfatase activity